MCHTRTSWSDSMKRSMPPTPRSLLKRRGSVFHQSLRNCSGSGVTTTTKFGAQSGALDGIPEAVAISEMRLRTNSPADSASPAANGHTGVA